MSFSIDFFGKVIKTKKSWSRVAINGAFAIYMIVQTEIHSIFWLYRTINTPIFRLVLQHIVFTTKPYLMFTAVWKYSFWTRAIMWLILLYKVMLKGWDIFLHYFPVLWHVDTCLCFSQMLVELVLQRIKPVVELRKYQKHICHPFFRSRNLLLSLCSITTDTTYLCQDLANWLVTSFFHLCPSPRPWNGLLSAIWQLGF